VLTASFIKPYPRTAAGFQFAENDDIATSGGTVDHLYHNQHLSDLYLRADPQYQGRFSPALLWDKKTHTAVNNVKTLSRVFSPSS
jgi:putative glutathione S-transferase